jgi:hypothetical protein
MDVQAFYLRQTRILASIKTASFNQVEYDTVVYNCPAGRELIQSPGGRHAFKSLPGVN